MSAQVNPQANLETLSRKRIEAVCAAFEPKSEEGRCGAVTNTEHVPTDLHQAARRPFITSTMTRSVAITGGSLSASQTVAQ